mgnify:CR=1 FL=1
MFGLHFLLSFNMSFTYIVESENKDGLQDGMSWDNAVLLYSRAPVLGQRCFIVQSSTCFGITLFYCIMT